MSYTTDKQQIQQIDKTLSLLREMWLDSKPEDKPKFMERINAILDQRNEVNRGK